ncbi:response regulator [Longilinea arvoryzae]|uniref:response regulator n=1 Tax=Longilinea arvoryzae TaxID=360412 RepID=UPI0015609476|nr:response regulator [Longilinea arvoryzae]
MESDPRAVERVNSALSSGFVVTSAADQPAAKACLEVTKFDLVLVEPWQVGTNGPELRAWLLDLDFPMPSVILTSRTFPIAIAMADRLDAVAILLKTETTYTDLATTCRQLVTKHRHMLQQALSIDNGMILLSPDLLVQSYDSNANQIFREMLGRDLAVGLAAGDVMAQGDFQFLKNLVDELIKKGQEKWVTPIPILLDHGRWIKTSFNLLYREKNRIDSICINFQDLTQSIDFQEKLRSREETLRTLINVYPASIFLIDPKGNILAANDGVSSWYRLPNEKFVETNIFDYLQSPVREFRQKIVEEIVKTGQTRTVTEFSQGRYLRTTVYPVFDDAGDVHQIGIFVVDVTEQKLADEVFKRRDAILEAVNFASEQFLWADSWRDRIQEVLQRWGEATATNRAFIYKRSLDDAGDAIYSLMYGWDSSGSIPDFAWKEFQNFSMKSTIYADIEEIINRGEAAQIKISEVGSGLFESFQEHKVKSLLVVPVMLSGDVWGFLGFGDSNTIREWSIIELDAVKTAAQIFSAALRRERDETSRAALLDALPDLMFLFNRNGEFVDYHTQDPSMLALPPEQFLGKKIGRALSGEVAKMTQKAFKQVMLTGVPMAYEYQLRIGNSQYWQGHMVRSGDGAVVIIHDITEQRRFEEELRQAEKVVSDLNEITSSSDLSFEKKQQELLKMGCQRFGVENGVILQPTADAFRIIQAYSPNRTYLPYTNLPTLESFSQQVIQSKKMLIVEDAAQDPLWKDHPVYLAHKLQSYMGAPLMMEGKLFGVLAFSSTQPHRKPFTMAEQRFLHLMAQWISLELEREQNIAQLQSYADEISRKNVELAEARDQALEVSRMKTEFLATMGHEIRTPMNAVMGMTELLLDSPLGPEQRQYAETARDSARLLLSLLNDVLDFSKIEAGKLVLQQVPFDPHKVLDEAVTMFGLQAQSKKIQLNVFISPQIPHLLQGDPVRFSQVVINLVANAIKFTDQGHVMVWCEVLNETPENVELMIRVRDTGIGLPDTFQDKVFQPFTQADGSTTRRFGGTGLGLSITKRLVEKMNGTIGFESKEGAGSVFWFTADFGRVEDASIEKMEAYRSGTTTQKILVYESLTETRDLWQRYLEDWGIPFELVENPCQVIERLKTARDSGLNYAVCILDAEGLRSENNKFYSQVMRLLRAAQCRFILITSFEKRLRNPGNLPQELFCGRLSRPFSHNTIEKVLAGVLPDQFEHPSTEEAAPSSKDEGCGNQPLTDKLILVAEDNLANQHLVEVQLQRLGYEVVTVATGSQAVDELARRHDDYGMVLMDMQMPEMDGCEATCLIRKNEQATGRHIPVVAMTASAMHVDRQACLQAGMDDYIVKPVLMDDLRKVIARSLLSAEPDQATAPGSEEPAATDTLLDERVLTDLRSLNQPGQPDFLKQLIDIYLADSATLMQTIHDSAQKDEPESLRQAVHSMKGISSNLGAQRLSDLCWQIEYAIRNQVPLPDHWLVSMDREYALTCQALQQVP